MKITMLGSGSYRSSLSFRLIKLAQELAANWDVTVILPSADKYNAFSKDANATIKGVRLVQPWQFTTRKPSLNLLPYIMTAAVALVRSRPAIVYLYKPTPISVIGVIAKLALGSKLVVDIDDLGSEVMRRQHQSAVAVKLVAMSESIALKFADKIIVTSTYLAKMMGDKYPHTPISVVPNGVDAAQYEKAADETLRHHIYYFGAIDTLDLVEDLLHAVRDLKSSVPDVTVSIIGNGTALKDAKALAGSLGVESFVSFPGYVDMFAVRDMVQFGDIAICYQPDVPTVRAASNMKVFQYMAMSSVPVVSNVGDLSAYVLGGEAGVVVPPHDTEKLKQALEAILTDDEARISIARTGRKLAENAYSWNSRAARVNEYLGASA